MGRFTDVEDCGFLVGIFLFNRRGRRGRGEGKEEWEDLQMLRIAVFWLGFFYLTAEGAEGAERGKNSGKIYRYCCKILAVACPVLCQLNSVDRAKLAFFKCDRTLESVATVCMAAAISPTL